MKFSLLTTFSISCFVIVSHSLSISDQQGAEKFLKKFGYINEANGLGGTTGEGTEPVVLSNALKDFQTFVGLRVTGRLDQDTILKMNAPRCGVRDIFDPSESARRKRYAVHGSKWGVHLTYRVSKYPAKIRDRSKVDGEMARAFNVWTDNTTLTFEERKTGRVNIDIRFEASNFNDSDAFDGQGKTLAYALFPRDGGDIYFNDDEEWTIDEGPGANLFQVATHEIGHSLGLLHTKEKEAVMTPYYTEYNPSLKLHMDDFEAIQSLYGWTDQQSEPEEDPPDLCQDAKMDAMTHTDNGTTYVFKGNFYWRVHDDKIVEGFPRRISDDWGGLEGNLDASFSSNEKTYFFKGGRCWRFTGQNMDPGYPRLLSANFEGIPDDLDAAVVWNRDKKLYFFKGAQYWRYDSGDTPPVKRVFPSPIREWKGVPNDIDAVVRFDNGKTYFFKDDKYYRYDDASSEVDLGYPLATATFWLSCKFGYNNLGGG